MRRSHSRFQLDVSGYRLLRDGRVVRLPRQPMELLLLLASRCGELITREEIAKQFWSDDVFVDVDRSINRIVRELRIALHDSPDRPRFVETVIGKGYRLVQPLDVPIRSVAVLPFRNMSGDHARDYVVDGLTGELISQIGALGAMRVISRTSVERFRAGWHSVQAIAAELQVDAVIEGTVHMDGNRIRVSASLIQALQEKQVWTTSFDADFADAVAVQHDIAHAIAAHLQIPSSPPGRRRIRRTSAGSGRTPPRSALRAGRRTASV